MISWGRCRNSKRGEPQPGFKIELHYKDLGLTMETGRGLGVPLPVTAIVQEMFNSPCVKGRGSLDDSAIITLLEDLGGVQVRNP